MGAKARKTPVAPAPLPMAPPSGPYQRVSGLLLGWVLTGVFFLGLQHFQPVFMPGFYALSPEQWFRLDLLFLAGTALLWWGMRTIPEGDPKDDIGRVPARVMLLGILGLAAFMRLYGLGTLDLYPANFWDDQSRPLLDAFQILENHHFITYGSIEPGEPLYAYCLALVMYLFPKLGGILVERLVSSAFDVTAVWVFYLLGKEFGKRRIGLLMASFGAVCRPMLMMVLSYMRYPTLPVALALVLLFCVRLFKKPSAGHFLQWSLSLGFCYYTYTAFRPLGPFFLVSLLVWVLWREREQGSQVWNRALGAGLLGLLAFLFIYLHRFYFNPQSAFRQLVEFLFEKARLEYFWGVALVAVGVKIWLESGKDWMRREIIRWTWAALLFAGLVTPALMPLELRTRLANSDTLIGGSVHTVFDVAGVFLHRISLTLNTLFYSGQDRLDCSLLGDPFFDVVSLTFILPGLVYVALKPKPLHLFILLTALLGLTPHVLTDPAGSRLIDCIVPLLLLGALGVNRIMEGAAASPQAGWKGVVFLAWIGLVGFGADVNFKKIYLHFEQMPRPEVALARQAGEDSASNRVYLGWYQRPEHVMNENKPVYRFLTDSNTIYLSPGEKAPDLVVVMRSDEIPQAGIGEKLKAQFPQAQFTLRPLLPFHPDDPATLVRILIPGTAVGGDKTKLFHIERVPDGTWTRKFYEAGYRLGCGLIVAEDRAATADAPFLAAVPVGTLGECSGRLERQWEAPEDGKYAFSVKTDQSLDLWIGDKLVLHLRPGSKDSYQASAYFPKGLYPVRLLVLNPTSHGVPVVSVRIPGSDNLKPL